VPLAHPLEQSFLPRTSTDASLQEHAAELHPALERFSVLSISSPEDVHGAVGPAFLHSQRGLVPKARALSHYSGEPLLFPANSRSVRG
jgi:hypothetical protein